MGTSRRTGFILLVVLLLVLPLLDACGGATTEQEGVIIGISAEIPGDELSGEIENMAYNGTLLVLLPDNEEVIANCAEEFLSDIKGAPVFSADQIRGGFVAEINIHLDDYQKVLLVHNEADEWEVVKVLQ